MTTIRSLMRRPMVILVPTLTTKTLSLTTTTTIMTMEIMTLSEHLLTLWVARGKRRRRGRLRTGLKRDYGLKDSESVSRTPGLHRSKSLPRHPPRRPVRPTEVEFGLGSDYLHHQDTGDSSPNDSEGAGVTGEQRHLR